MFLFCFFADAQWNHIYYTDTDDADDVVTATPLFVRGTGKLIIGWFLTATKLNLCVWLNTFYIYILK